MKDSTKKLLNDIHGHVDTCNKKKVLCMKIFVSQTLHDVRQKNLRLQPEQKKQKIVQKKKKPLNISQSLRDWGPQTSCEGQFLVSTLPLRVFASLEKIVTRCNLQKKKIDRSCLSSKQSKNINKQQQKFQRRLCLLDKRKKI